MYANDSKLVRRTPSYGARGVLAAAIAMVALAGCGGGGGSMDPAANSGGSGGSSGGTGGGSGSGSGGSGSGSGGSGGTGSGGSGGGSTSGAPPVVYLAEQDTLGIYELYMSTSTGSVKVNGPLVPNGWVHDFAVSPNGDFVVYAADQDTENRTELYLVNLANPGASTKLNVPLTINRDVTGFDISPDSSKVVYRADQDAPDVFDLFLVNVANPGSAVKVNAPLVAGGYVFAGFSFSPDSSQIVYRADQDVDETPEIFLANIATPGTAQQLNPELTAGGEISSVYRFSPDGTKVGYIADQDVDERQELFVVSVAAPGVSAKLNSPMTAGGNVCRFEFSHDSTRVAYCGDQETDDVMELFLVSIDAPGVSQKLNPALASGGNVGSRYDFSADDTFIVYEAEQEVVDLNELYRVDLAAPGVATKLNAPIVGGGGTYNNDYYNGVYMFRIRPDGQHVDYVANQESGNVWELYQVGFANPGAATKLTPTMAGVGMFDFDYSPDGARIVYLAAQDTEFADLYGMELSTPAVSTKVNGTLAAGGEVWDFTIIP
jgi:Tol biopolymer transport system component